MLVYKEYLSLQTIAIQDFVNFIMHQNHLEDLLKCRLFSNNLPRFLDSICLEWGLRICTSNKFPSDTDATVSLLVPGTTL